MTQMIGPFSSTPSSNQLTVECDLKKSNSFFFDCILTTDDKQTFMPLGLIELPYIGGMELRVAIFQTVC
jgi:hypothetical protein